MATTKNVYGLPLHKKDLKEAVSDNRVHDGILSHAIDFTMEEGSEILAAADGEVILIQVHSDEGGFEEKYQKDPIKFLNYISIEHENGETSEYGHLLFNSAKVKVGEKVKKGQVIALSGNTGLSTEPHLHFHVAGSAPNEHGWETLDIQFDEEIEVLRN